MSFNTLKSTASALRATPAPTKRRTGVERAQRNLTITPDSVEAIHRLSNEGIHIGSTAAALSLFGPYTGALITPTSLTAYLDVFPMIELAVEAQHPPHEEMLRGILFGSSAKRLGAKHTLSWHIAITDEKQLTDPSPEFLLFAQHIAQGNSAQSNSTPGTIAHDTSGRSNFIYALDATIPFSEKALSGFLTSRELLSDIPLLLEATHPSWKRQTQLARLKREKIVHVAIDAPPLFGIVKDVNYTLPKRSYLRLLGRDPKKWFDPVPERFEYEYGQTELKKIARRIHELRATSDQVAVVCATHTPEHALKNSLQLARLVAQSLA